MLFHMSIDADDPQHVAEVLAELMGGRAAPFPPVAEGSWFALADDGRGSMIEVYPRGTELHEVEGDADAVGLPGATRRHGPTHFALGTRLDPETVFVLAAEQGWPAKYRSRDGMFGVIEMWVERCLMIEVLTPSMQAEYVHGFAAPMARMLEEAAALPRAA